MLHPQQSPNHNWVTDACSPERRQNLHTLLSIQEEALSSSGPPRPPFQRAAARSAGEERCFFPSPYHTSNVSLATGSSSAGLKDRGQRNLVTSTASLPLSHLRLWLPKGAQGTRQEAQTPAPGGLRWKKDLATTSHFLPLSSQSSPFFTFSWVKRTRWPESRNERHPQWYEMSCFTTRHSLRYRWHKKTWRRRLGMGIPHSFSRSHLNHSLLQWNLTVAIILFP